MAISSAVSAPTPANAVAGVRALEASEPVPATSSERPSRDSGGGTAVPAAPGAASDRAALERATAALNEHFQLHSAALKFSIDEDTDRIVVKVVDSRDGALIRQIPSEEALRLAQALRSETPPSTPSLLQQVA